MEGTVAQVRVKPGDRVFPGEELVVLRDPEAANKLEEHLLDIRQRELELEGKVQALTAAERDLSAALSDLDRVQNRNRGGDRSPLMERQLDIERAELELQDLYHDAEDARINLESEREKLEADRELFDRGFIALNELKAQEETVRNAETRVRTAQLEIETKRLAIDRLYAGIGTLQHTIDNTIDTREDRIRQARDSVRSKQAQADRAQSELRPCPPRY